MSAKKKRVVLSTGERLKILDRLHAGESRLTIVNETGIGMRTIERLVASEKTIRHEAESTENLSRKRKRIGRNESLDDVLGQWFSLLQSEIKNKS